MTIWTIGHSTRPIEDFVALLKAHGVHHLADVRTVPRSRHNPQFNTDQLAKSLKKAQLGYRHMPQLGGLRKAHKDSINTAWRNASFRGYADYMQTNEFWAALDHLITQAHKHPTAIMCAEAVPWRCHRSLIGDALVSRGWTVLDIMTEKRADPHVLTSFAKVCHQRVTYPSPGDNGTPRLFK
jgi:uncharacterized protein (DUF488 family)